MILDLVNTCNDAALANLLAILKNMLSLIQLVGPIIALVSLTFIFVRLMSNPENKKLKNAIKNCLLALVLMFFVPIFINALMLLFDDKFTLSACWNSAKVNSEVEFIETDSDEDKDDKKNNTVIVDPDSYEKGGTDSSGDG